MELKRKLNGFRVSWRNKHIKLQHLSDREFRLLEIYIDLAVWDKINYKETYGTTDVTNADIALLWDCSESKVSRCKKKLLERGNLIREREDERVEVLKFFRYEVDKALVLAKEETLAEAQGVDARMQDLQMGTDSDAGYKTCADTGRNRGGLAEMQEPLPSKGLISFKSSLDTPPRKKEDFESFAKEAMAELKRNDPLEADNRVVLPEEMVTGGFPTNTHHEPCPICKSGVDFIDCCGPLMYESLKGVRG